MKSLSPLNEALGITFIEHYLNQVKDEENNTLDGLSRLQARLEDLRTERTEAEKVLHRLQRRAGVAPSLSAAAEHTNGDGGKGELFKAFAIGRADQGFTIADVSKVFSDRGINIGKNYPYFLVDMRFKNNLRKVGATRNGKRYYWIESTTASE